MSHRLTAEIHFLSKGKKIYFKRGMKENLLFLIQRIILEVIHSD